MATPGSPSRVTCHAPQQCNTPPWLRTTVTTASIHRDMRTNTNCKVCGVRLEGRSGGTSFAPLSVQTAVLNLSHLRVTPHTPEKLLGRGDPQTYKFAELPPRPHLITSGQPTLYKHGPNFPRLSFDTKSWQLTGETVHTAYAMSQVSSRWLFNICTATPEVSIALRPPCDCHARNLLN